MTSQYCMLLHCLSQNRSTNNEEKAQQTKRRWGRSINAVEPPESQVDWLHEQLLKHFANVREVHITPAEARRRAKCSDQMTKQSRRRSAKKSVRVGAILKSDHAQHNERANYPGPTITQFALAEARWPGSVRGRQPLARLLRSECKMRSATQLSAPVIRPQNTRAR